MHEKKEYGRAPHLLQGQQVRGAFYARGPAQVTGRA